jgi:hypothetical protein
MAPLFGARPPVSRAIRSNARVRSSGVSHLVVRGESGSRYMAATATANVTTPSILKSLELRQSRTTRKISLVKLTCHPFSPRAPSIDAKVAAAINPANEVAKLSPEYRIHVLVAISFLV